MDARAKCDDELPATVDFTSRETLSLPAEIARPEGFAEGAVWALGKMAEWLETTSFVADDEATQRGVDGTKKLIAEQVRQAASNLRIERPKPR